MIPKFRAWDKKHNEMIRVISINFDEKFVRGLTAVESNLDMESSYNFEEIEILQSTGLKDKNGTEIYEGDVLKIFILDNKGPHAKVIFKNGMFGIEDDMFGYGYDKGLYSLDQILSIRDAEIIGNKYEHPHLLRSDGE